MPPHSNCVTRHMASHSGHVVKAVRRDQTRTRIWVSVSHCWKSRQRLTILTRVQIGSYFGSVLQTVDINGDSFTDLLLIGAPMFMGTERDEQGQVYVYKLNQVANILGSDLYFLNGDGEPTDGSLDLTSLYFFLFPLAGWPVWARVHFKACQSVLLHCPFGQLFQ